MAVLNVDFTKPIGTIKPMHAVGQPPFIGMNFSMCDYLQKAHIGEIQASIWPEDMRRECAEWGMPLI